VNLVWFLAWIGLLEATEVRVATLNIGHGRGDSRHQVLQSTEEIYQNLTRVSELVEREGIDVLALQEVDHQAWWSGNRSQSNILGDELQLAHRFQGVHSQKSRLQYGTSILTSYEMLAQKSSVHRSTFPLPS
jgi:endonuclease/exonuclease/phosphatase family metal-dependent hydrolase